MPNIPAELVGREEIRAWGERVPALVDYLVQTTHPGTIQLDGDTASGRAYLQELVHARDGRSELNYAIYHDRYQRASDGWKLTERVYEVRYRDTTPLAGSAPSLAQPGSLTTAELVIGTSRDGRVEDVKPSLAFSRMRVGLSVITARSFVGPVNVSRSLPYIWRSRWRNSRQGAAGSSRDEV